MGNSIQKPDDQVRYLKQRLNMFMEVIDSLDPEHLELDDIDGLIRMLDDMEKKCEQFK